MCGKHYMRVRDGRPLHDAKDFKPKCAYHGCKRIAFRKGVCRKHRCTAGELPASCTMPECDGKYYAKGFCHLHYSRDYNWRKRKPKKPKPPPIAPKQPLTRPGPRLATLVAQAVTRAAYLDRQQRRRAKNHG